MLIFHPSGYTKKSDVTTMRGCNRIYLVIGYCVAAGEAWIMLGEGIKLSYVAHKRKGRRIYKSFLSDESVGDILKINIILN